MTIAAVDDDNDGGGDDDDKDDDEDDDSDGGDARYVSMATIFTYRWTNTTTPNNR